MCQAHTCDVVQHDTILGREARNHRFRADSDQNRRARRTRSLPKQAAQRGMPAIEHEISRVFRPEVGKQRNTSWASPPGEGPSGPNSKIRVRTQVRRTVKKKKLEKRPQKRSLRSKRSAYRRAASSAGAQRRQGCAQHTERSGQRQRVADDSHRRAAAKQLAIAIDAKRREASSLAKQRASRNSASACSTSSGSQRVRRVVRGFSRARAWRETRRSASEACAERRRRSRARLRAAKKCAKSSKVTRFEQKRRTSTTK